MLFALAFQTLLPDVHGGLQYHMGYFSRRADAFVTFEGDDAVSASEPQRPGEMELEEQKALPVPGIMPRMEAGLQPLEGIKMEQQQSLPVPGIMARMEAGLQPLEGINMEQQQSLPVPGVMPMMRNVVTAPPSTGDGNAFDRASGDEI